MASPLLTITANQTRDGAVTYVTSDGTGWTGSLEHCFRTADQEDAERVLGWARTQEAIVCDPYLLPLVTEDGVVRARSARERIRAAGPLETLQRLGYGA